MRVAVTGALGQVGRELETALLRNFIEVVPLSRERLDITNFEEVLAVLEASGASTVINAAAFTDVEGAESQKEAAFAVNEQGALNLAKSCRILGMDLIHISTDYVFSKETGCAHKEDDETSTSCVYGQSKLKGEEAVMQSGCNYIIVRSSWIFGKFGKNFVKTMLKLGMERNEVRVVFDQQGNPTPAQALAEGLVTAAVELSKKQRDLKGIYHFAGKPETSWDLFASKIFERAFETGLISHDVRVRSISSFEYPVKAVRPSDSRLDTTKFEETFNFKMPLWEDYLEETLEQAAFELTASYQEKSPDREDPMEDADKLTCLRSDDVREFGIDTKSSTVRILQE